MKKLCRLFFALAVTSSLVFGITACKSGNEAGGAKRSLTGLEITTPAARTYEEGQTFDKSKLVVTAKYRDKPSKNVTDDCTYDPGLDTPLAYDDTVIVISYTEDGFTLKAHHGITVYLAGNGPPGGTQVVTGVTVNPSVTRVQKGTTFTFGAIVAGENNPSQDVIWTVDGGGAGTSISINGLLTVAADETATSLTVKAASVVDEGVFGTAAVTLTTEAVVPVITSVKVNPATVTVVKGGNRQFNAEVEGTDAEQAVTWSVEGANAGTNISQTGFLTVVMGETATTLTVKATSTVDTSKSGTATVTVPNISNPAPNPNPNPITQYTVTFDSNGGSNIPNQTVNSGSMAGRPARPTRNGFTFEDWYTAAVGGAKYNFNLPVASHFTLYAHWIEGSSNNEGKIALFDGAGIRLGAFIRATWGIPVALRPSVNPGWAGGYEGWNPGWTAAQIKGEYLTDLMLAFALITSDQQTLAFSDSGTSINPTTHYLWNELALLQQKYPHLRINLSVGGWNGPHFADMAKNPAKRAAFVENCINLIREKGLDGLDIDWEYPVTGGQYPEKATPADADNWVSLLRVLREALTALGQQTGKTYKLSACCPVGNEFINANKPQEAAQYVDSLTLMAYDMAGSWEPKALHAAPLYQSPGMPASWSTDEAITGYTAKGTPPKNIMVGFPAYGMGWTVATGLTGDKPGYNTSGPAFLQETNRLYDDIKQLKNAQGYQYYWDDTAKAPFLYNSSTGGWITYCDDRQVQELAKYIKQKNLGGMFYWEYAGDWDTELLEAAFNALVDEYGL